MHPSSRKDIFNNLEKKDKIPFLRYMLKVQHTM